MEVVDLLEEDHQENQQPEKWDQNGQTTGQAANRVDHEPSTTPDRARQLTHTSSSHVIVDETKRRRLVSKALITTPGASSTWYTDWLPEYAISTTFPAKTFGSPVGFSRLTVTFSGRTEKTLAASLIGLSSTKRK